MLTGHPLSCALLEFGADAFDCGVGFGDAVSLTRPLFIAQPQQIRQQLGEAGDPLGFGFSYQGQGKKVSRTQRRCNWEDKLRAFLRLSNLGGRVESKTAQFEIESAPRQPQDSGSL